MNSVPRAVIDPAAVLADIRVSSDGWRMASAQLSGAGRSVDGLVSPDGRAWEAHSFEWPTRPKALKELAAYVDTHRKYGYEQALVQLDGRWYRAERYGNNVEVWTGLQVHGDWIDSSCHGCPWQHYAAATFRDVSVTLYVRWRWADPWAGHVIKAAPDDEGLYRKPWSPNLLPTGAQDQPALSLSDMLSGMRTEPPGIREDDEALAKTTLIDAADVWLRAHFDDPQAWTTGRQYDGPLCEARYDAW